MMERGLKRSDALGTHFCRAIIWGLYKKLNLLCWWLILLNHPPFFNSFFWTHVIYARLLYSTFIFICYCCLV